MRRALWPRAPDNGVPQKSQRAKRCEIFGEEEQQECKGLAASYARRLPSAALLRRAPQRENTIQSFAKAKRISGCLSTHGKFFHQLEKIFVNFLKKRKPRFGGSARGKFLAAARAGSRSLPPRLRPFLHKNLGLRPAIFRETVDKKVLYFITLCAWQNHAFA